MNTTKRTTTLAALITASTFLVACSDATAPSSTQAPQSQADSHDHDHAGHDHDHDTATTTAPDFYSNILGEITQIPVQGDPSKSLRIHHQQIPNFKTKDGAINVSSKGISGMASMTMEFPLAEGVNIDDLAIGDKVSFDFQVNWGGDAVAWEVTKIEKIDPATQIDYTNKIEDIKDAAEDLIDDMTGHDDHAGHDHDMPKGP